MICLGAVVRGRSTSWCWFSDFHQRILLVQLRTEHEATAVDTPALHILSRAPGVQDSARQTTPIPSGVDAPPANAVDGHVAREMATVNQRLFTNACIRSIDALLLPASFRFATLIEWLPWLLAFTFAALLDGTIVRQIKAKGFRQHSPELFALYTCDAIITVCATVVGFVVPFTLHPPTMPCVPLVVSLLLSRAVGRFHRRGGVASCWTHRRLRSVLAFESVRFCGECSAHHLRPGLA